MILRPRQEVFVSRCLDAIKERGNTLGVAPTGSGKTVMFCDAIVQHGGSALVLQHRDELVAQNSATFTEHAEGNAKLGYWTGKEKRWGKHTFAMVPTLSRPEHLEAMPAFDLVVVDEAHHGAAETWQRVVARARELNPDVHVLGVTATPNRGDGAGLRSIFDNVGDQIGLYELIKAGHLVPPRAFVLDVGVSEQLKDVKKLSTGEYDSNEVAEILGEPVLPEVIRHWRERAGDRRTVWFASTIAHAELVQQALVAENVPTGLVTGETPAEERRETFAALASGGLQCLVNVMVATEGWDCPPVSCVALLRRQSYHSTLIQMVGRGLRTCPPDKQDCIVLDFGQSLLVHGDLVQVPELEGAETSDDGARQKQCPECGVYVPWGTLECPLCNYLWPISVNAEGQPVLAGFDLVELDILNASPFAWWKANDRTMVATGFDAWAVAVAWKKQWHAVGGWRVERVPAAEGEPPRYRHEAAYLATGSREWVLAQADDHMRHREKGKASRKTRGWLSEAPSPKQIDLLGDTSTAQAIEAPSSRYEASCALTLKWRRVKIRKCLQEWEAAQ
jgi:DNA repair protein RadD